MSLGETFIWLLVAFGLIIFATIFFIVGGLTAIILLLILIGIGVSYYWSSRKKKEGEGYNEMPIVSEFKDKDERSKN